IILCLVFFFQAEDGIRGFHVTGVQTCALPISTQLADVVISFVYLQAKTSADCKLTTSLSFPSCPSFVLAGRFTVPTSTITFSYERAAAPFTDVPTETDNPY